MTKIVEFYKKYKKALQIIGGLISALAILWSVYTYFYPINQNPNITIYLKNASNVFEINGENKDIKILVRDKDILKEKLNLRVITLKIINDGKSDISPNDFDLLNEPFGIAISKGEIISAEIDAPSLKNLLNIQDKTKSDSLHFIFKSFIFPKKQFFFVRLTLLYSVDKELPLIYSMGRIANADINITNEAEDNNTLREIIYLIVSIGIVVGIFFIIGKIAEWITSFRFKRRKRKITRIYQLYFKDESKYMDAIINIYSEKGMSTFKIFRKATADKGRQLIKKSAGETIGRYLTIHNCCTEEDAEIIFKNDFLHEINQIEKFI